MKKAQVDDGKQDEEKTKERSQASKRVENGSKGDNGRMIEEVRLFVPAKQGLVSLEQAGR